MRVAVTGATGNHGSALVRRLVADPEVDEVVGLARRLPDPSPDGVRWEQADVVRDDLAGYLQGVDALVHLAWQIQPGRDETQLWEVNAVGSERVFAAAAAAGIRTVVYASSIGAYSPASDDVPVREDHPTHGIATSTYSRQKAYVERLLDAFELRHPEVRVVRMRPALTFQRAAASEVRRFFLGTLFPDRLATLAPVLPRIGTTFQAVHTDDVAAAYQAALHREVHGAFNLAADPPLTLEDVAEVIGARSLPVPRALVKPAAALTWRLRLHPVEPGWVDLALRSPIMDTARARDELGWSPTADARGAVAELLEGIADREGAHTPTLEPDDEQDRLAEARTGQGARYAADDRTPR